MSLHLHSIKSITQREYYRLTAEELRKQMDEESALRAAVTSANKVWWLYDQEERV